MVPVHPLWGNDLPIIFQFLSRGFPVDRGIFETPIFSALTFKELSLKIRILKSFKDFFKELFSVFSAYMDNKINYFIIHGV